jgi:hypothetical protein
LTELLQTARNKTHGIVHWRIIMKSTIKIAALAAALAVASIGTAEAASPDAQIQAGGLLMGGTPFNSSAAQGYLGSTTAGYAVSFDAQSQARAILTHDQSPAPSHDKALAATSQAARPSTRLANGTAQKSLDAQTRAATVLMGSGA